MIQYELDWSRPDALEFTNHSLVGVLTGLPYEEIEAARKQVWLETGRKGKRGWYGQSFIKVLYALGFNTSEAWIKFDPFTDKPCIMRTNTEDRNGWYAWIYHDGLINNSWTLDEWKKEYSFLKITSMLQVWI